MKMSLNVSLVSIGKLRGKPLKELADDYIKRISKYTSFKDLEISHQKLGKQKGNLANSVENIFCSARTRVALDVRGKDTSSEDIARLLQGASIDGGGISFIIGGPEGIPPEFDSMANKRISLSRCTFPHELFRVIFLEQLYRGLTIFSGVPYHK
jgi:23S rRNA (pseudouridine1915-N3)-methyltransferase